MNVPQTSFRLPQRTNDFETTENSEATEDRAGPVKQPSEAAHPAARIVDHQTEGACTKTILIHYEGIEDGEFPENEGDAAKAHPVRTLGKGKSPRR